MIIGKDLINNMTFNVLVLKFYKSEDKTLSAKSFFSGRNKKGKKRRWERTTGGRGGGGRGLRVPPKLQVS